MNRVAFHSLINGHCSLGQTEESFGVVGLMSARGISPNVITNTLLIKGYCKQEKFEAAEKLLNSMKEMTRFVPDEVSYGGLINAYYQLRKMDDLIFRDEMSSVGLQANLFVCNAMINGHCSVGRIGKQRRW